MPKRRPYIRKYTFTINFCFNIGASFRSTEAIGKKIAHLVRKMQQFASKARILLNCWWHKIWQRIKSSLRVAKGLATICVVVIVANHLAAQLNGQFHLGLPSETMQVMVEMVAVYLLKK